MIFNLVFFIAITSVIIQGTTLPPWQNAASDRAGRAKRRSGSDLEFIDPPCPCGKRYCSHHSIVNGRRIVEIDFPKTAKILWWSGVRIILLCRVHGAPGDDKLLILAENERAFSLAMTSLGMANR